MEEYTEYPQLSATERLVYDKLQANYEQLEQEVMSWIEANNLGMKLIMEQTKLIMRLYEHLKRIHELVENDSWVDAKIVEAVDAALAEEW